MANKSVFASLVGRLVPATDTVNYEVTPAYAYDAKHKLAQLAVTGTFGDAFYASAELQVDELLEATQAVDADYLAKTAIYARKNAFMKDAPAFLLAVLSGMDSLTFLKAFPHVVDNGKMLRNFVQIMRSGATGRKSLGSAPKRAVQNWLLGASDQALIAASVGNDPSLSDVIKMVHPKPKDAEREALFAWVMDKPHDFALLPKALKGFAFYKADQSAEMPDVPFQMLAALDLGKEAWTQIALNGRWHMVRMNLNTFLRHSVLEDEAVVEALARKIADPEVISQARVFPYQLMTALRSVDPKMPRPLVEALEDALELATKNVPEFQGKVAVCVDVSGSMGSPVTGFRRGATSVTRCVDVAALVASTVLRQNRDAMVLPFDGVVRDIRLNARDSIATNAAKLSHMMGGATNCAAPMETLSKMRKPPDLVIYVSDNQSWVDAGWGNQGTMTMRHWNVLKSRNSKAKMVCIDIQPYGTTQVKERADILNIGGFADNIFDVIDRFAKGTLTADHWVGEIERIEF